jgi:hypothetical protein
MQHTEAEAEADAKSSGIIDERPCHSLATALVVLNTCLWPLRFQDL